MAQSPTFSQAFETSPTSGQSPSFMADFQSIPGTANSSPFFRAFETIPTSGQSPSFGSTEYKQISLGIHGSQIQKNSIPSDRLE